MVDGWGELSRSAQPAPAPRPASPRPRCKLSARSPLLPSFSFVVWLVLVWFVHSATESGLARTVPSAGEADSADSHSRVVVVRLQRIHSANRHPPQFCVVLSAFRRPVWFVPNSSGVPISVCVSVEVK